MTLPRELDVDQIRELGAAQTEVQPFAADEWEQLMQTIAKPYRSGEAEKVFLDRVSGFDAAQCKVISQVLEHLRDFYGDEFPNREPEIALERYWHQYRA